MEYTVAQLGKISGVSARTLRYYDKIGLLKPLCISRSGYRVYGPEQVELLQQILLYRELGFCLRDIKAILDDPSFDKIGAFEAHLSALMRRRDSLDSLIGSVQKSLDALKGDVSMTDKERFDGFGQALVEQNESLYGEEVRQRYGDAEADGANKHVAGMTQDRFQATEELRLRMEDLLKAAFELGDPDSHIAWQACDLHRQWLCEFYPKYSKEYHKGLAQMYVCDERFRANYDKLGEGCTEFLRDAIFAYCG